MKAAELTAYIKESAMELGFMDCGVAKATFLEEEAPRLEKWLKAEAHGEMAYMANNFDKRLDPRLLVEGAKSVVSLSYNYYTPLVQADAEAPKISKYAYGRDYHKVIKQKLLLLLNMIKEKAGDIYGRAFVDSAPVMERAWAKRSGLGWQGKNTNLISKDKGSFFFLAELIIDLELEYDVPYTKDYCGSCTKCIDACPTQAITAPNYVDARKCISYLTIELKEQIPQQFKGHMDNWMFGCDVCQDVCPWNRFSTPHSEPQFNPGAELLQLDNRVLMEITEDTFARVFSGSAVKRAKYLGLKRNINFLKNG